jgi:hypothetical protein
LTRNKKYQVFTPEFWVYGIIIIKVIKKHAVSVFRVKCFTSTLRMEKEFSFEILVTNYQITRYHNPEGNNKEIVITNFLLVQTEIKSPLSLGVKGRKYSFNGREIEWIYK